MPTKRIFDATGGVVSVIESNELDRTTTFAQYQDVSPYLDANKRLQTADDGFNQSRDMRRVASIPHVILMKWCREDGVSVLDFMRRPKAYQKWLRGKIYDPENAAVLTAPHARPRQAMHTIQDSE